MGNLIVFALTNFFLGSVSVQAGGLDDYFDSIGRTEANIDESYQLPTVQTLTESVYFGTAIGAANSAGLSTEEPESMGVGDNYNYFLGENTDGRVNDLGTTQNAFLGQRTADTQVDAYAGYLKTSKHYDPYQVFSNQRGVLDPHQSLEAEIESSSSSYWRGR